MVSLHRTSRGRKSTAVLAASASALLLGASLLSAPSAGAASAPVQVGLFGSQDPTYDGVFRQSLALLAYTAARTTPPAEAVTWLLGQQCPDGGFQAFRTSPKVACKKSDPVSYSGEDTNATGIAAAALRAIGRTAAADRALAWALAAQNADGGFPYYLHGSSDSNSTAIVLLGSNAAGRTPDSVQRGGVSAAHFLESLQIGCAGVATDDDGGFAFQDYGTGLVDSDTASVQATFALSGARLPLAAGPVSTDVPRATCPAAASAAPTGSAPTGSPSPSSATPSATPSTAAAAVGPAPAQLGAGHLARVLSAFGGAIPQFDFNAGARVPGSVSVGDTAWAALSLAAVGVGRTQLDAALGVLGRQTTAKASGTAAAGSTATAASASAAPPADADQPGLLALGALATSAGGGASTTVQAYVVRIGATMRVAPAVASPTASASPTPTGDSALSPTGATPLTPVLAGLGVLLVLLGAGALGSTRRRGVRA